MEGAGVTLVLGHRLGLPPSRVRRLLASIGHEAKVQDLLERSFLPEELKLRYAGVVADRRQR
ncbi:serine/threonine-protein kinase HipA [Hymenobacter psychrophilus]|uniref:Serine/threonine-protein kinase HipA n=1 Tax=Hymenobacter psychrophilus TaxID=651662 RepID=A0A1H3JR89_9BACT|nr:serine/threonine-protein kinase HipA [Hymenobacter psychrophilus]